MAKNMTHGTLTTTTAIRTLVIFATAAVMFGGAAAHAEGKHVARTHAHLMSSHARLQEHDADENRRDAVPTIVAPQTGYIGTVGTGKMDDPIAEGRTSGG